MPRLINNLFWSAAAFLLAITFALPAHAQSFIVHLKNGDRITGRITNESTNEVTLATPFAGSVTIPVSQVERREPVTETAQPSVSTAPDAAKTGGPKAETAAPAQKAKKEEPPLDPANLEAKAIAATPKYWQHRVDFGLNIRDSAKDQQEFLVIGKSTFAKQPFRHIFDLNFNYGRTDGVLSSHRLTGSQKTEYQYSKQAYVFNIIGGGYDEVRKIDGQYEIGPGFGVELINSSEKKFVWKNEIGFNYQQQFRADDTRITTYSVRIAEIFAWRIWEKLTADAKVEFFANLESFGEYRLRLESTLTYPLTDRMSLNLTAIDLYDSSPGKNIPPNDLQIRSTLGIKF